MKYIMVVAFDLAFDPTGEVIPGPETKIACHRAIRIARQDASKSIIVATAGIAPSKWKNVWMAESIQKYIRSVDRDVGVLCYTALTFNTYGEMECLAKMLKMSPVQNSKTNEVVLAVKWWHAPRSLFLCRHHLKKCGLGHLPVTVSSCPSFVSWKLIFKEYALSWPKNLIRVLID